MTTLEPLDRDAFIADSKRVIAEMTAIRAANPVRALLLADDYMAQWEPYYDAGEIESDNELEDLYVEVSCLHLDIMQVLTADMEAEYGAALAARS